MIAAGDPGEHTELVWVFDGEAVEENFFGDGVDGGVGTDAQGERCYGYEG